MKSNLLFSRASRDVLTLASGKFGAAAISLLSAPFIARLFEPSDFGVVAFLVVVAGLASQVLPLSYPNAISTPKNEGDAKALVRIAMTSSVALACIAYLSLSVLYVLDWPSPLAAQLDRWEWVVPAVALMLALSLVCEGWLTRTRGFVASSKAAFSQAVMTSGGRLSLGFVWSSSIWGLVIPYVAGVLLRLGILAQASWSNRHPDTASSPIARVAQEYSEFPRYNLPAGFLRALSDSLPVLFFASVFGTAAAGLYAMADRLIKTPLTMGALSVRRVYLQRASEIMHRGGDLKGSYTRVTGYLILLGLPPTLLLMLTGEPMLRLLLGARWAQAGVFVEVLAPLFYLMLISIPATALVDLLRKQRLWLKLQMVSSFFRATLMLLAWLLWNTEERVLWGFVLGGGVSHLWLMAYMCYMPVKLDNSEPDNSADN